jgi:hypothetical protein
VSALTVVAVAIEVKFFYGYPLIAIAKAIKTGLTQAEKPGFSLKENRFLPQS